MPNVAAPLLGGVHEGALAPEVEIDLGELEPVGGGDERLDADAVSHAYSGIKPMDAMIRRPGVFGPKVEAAPGDDLQTEFLKFLGRNV